jgi:hypothetical protein
MGMFVSVVSWRFESTPELTMIRPVPLAAAVDGKAPCLVLATSTGKILIHDPHSSTENRIRFLNINKRVTALGACAPPDSQNGRHVLLIGTQSTLLAHDVSNNADVFFKDVPDGVTALTVGMVGNVMVIQLHFADARAHPHFHNSAARSCV